MRDYYKLFFLLFPIIFLINSSVYSQTIKEESLSPLTTEARSPVLIGSALTLSLSIFEDQVVDPVQEETVENRPLGDFSRFGDIMGQLVPNIIYAGGMYLNSSFSNSVLMIKATLYSSLLTTVLKYTIREPRPNGQSRNSFPSGHTTTAFAFASVVGARHNIYWGIGAYTIAALVAYSRMNDNMHYIHDVTAGATIGIGYGLGLHYLEKKIGKVSYYLVPQITPSRVGLTYIKEF